MTPITTKSLGINQELGLEQELKVWQVNIDARSEVINVVYEIVTYSPTNTIIKNEYPLQYIRFNDTNGQMMFDHYRDSVIGQSIISAINQTLDNYPNLNQS
jgi:hypothetical protein